MADVRHLRVVPPAPPREDPLPPRSSPTGRRHATIVAVELGDAAMNDTLEDHASRVAAAGDAIATCIATHDGHVIHRVGSRLLAAFGAPVAVEQATRRALVAARAIQTIGPTRIGVESGVLLVDGDADPARSLTGEAVGIAWRLAAAARLGTVLLGTRVRAESAAFAFATPVTLPAPDGEPTVAWELGPAAQAPPARDDFVGRVHELAVLRARVAALGPRGGGWVDVVGVAGVGKSRFAREVASECARAGLSVLAGGCVAIGEQRGFGPFAEILRAWAGIEAGGSGGEAWTRLAAALQSIAPSEHESLAPVLARLIGIETTEPPIEGPALAAMVAHACRRFFEIVASAHPMVVVLEDLHWADASSVELLAALAPAARTAPLLFLVTRRPDPAEIGDALPEPLDRLSLATLDPDESAQLVRALAGDALLATHSARIAARTGGNPFFIEQVVRALATADPDTAEPAIPETVQQLLLARVDRLPAPLRGVLEAGAVTGPTIDQGTLAHVVDVPETLDADLSALVAAGLLVRTDAGVAFAHALAHEAVYEGITRRRRTALHARIADVLVASADEKRADRLGMLAYHFSRADRPLEAERYLIAAGDEATRTAASDVALHYFREAARLYLTRVGDGGDPERKAELHGRIGLALFNRGRFLEATESYTRALAFLGEKPSTSPWRLLSNGIVVGARLLAPWRRRGRPATPRDLDVLQLVLNRYGAEITADPARLLPDTLEGLRRLGPIDPSTLAQTGGLYAGLASIFFYGGVSFAVGRRLLVEAARAVHRDDAHDVLQVRAMQYIHDMLAGAWGRAEQVDDVLIEGALDRGRPWEVTTYLGIHAERRIHEGRFDEAQAVIARIAAIERRYDYQIAKQNRQAMTALLHLERGELEPAHDAARAYLRDHREDAPNVFAHGILATIEIASGDLDAAAASIARATRVIHRVGRIPPFHRVPCARAALLLELARDGAHARAVRPAVRLSRWIAWSVPDAYRLAAASHWRRGAHRRAVAAWSRAASEAIRLDLRPALARVYRDVGRRLVDRDAGHLRIGDVEAEGCPPRAAALFAELGIEHPDRTP